MARTLDPVAHAMRRDAFVDAAQRLIQSKGYEQTSLQDVLDELDTSRGAFYHYFTSKEALLEAVVDRMADAATATLAPIVADPDLPALRKLEAVFGGLSRWKAQRSELVLAILRVWLSDENAVVREKSRQLVAERLAPLLVEIVRQGRAEGAFTVGSADHSAAILVALIQGGQEMASRLYLARQTGAVSFEEVERSFRAYSEALERVLGIPEGSSNLVDPATLRFWLG